MLASERLVHSWVLVINTSTGRAAGAWKGIPILSDSLLGDICRAAQKSSAGYVQGRSADNIGNRNALQLTSPRQES
jgi:hypothetical protein